MGIGINYHGYDGKDHEFEFDGSPESQRKLEHFARMGAEEQFRPRHQRPASGMKMPHNLPVPPPRQPEREDDDEKYKVKTTAYDRPDYLGEKIDPNSSIQVFLGRLTLKGDMDDARPADDVAVYLKQGARRMWGGLDMIDPAEIGSLIGPDASMDMYEEDTTKWQLGDKTAPTFTICTRQICQPVYDDNSGAGAPPFLNLFSFWRKFSWSKGGRLVQVGGERRTLQATIVMGGNGKFEVRPYYCHKMADESEHQEHYEDGTVAYWAEDNYLMYLAFGPGNILASLPETLPTNIYQMQVFQGCYIVPVNPLVQEQVPYEQDQNGEPVE